MKSKIRKPLFERVGPGIYRAKFCDQAGTPLTIEMHGSPSGNVRVDVNDAKGREHFRYWTLFPIMYPTFRSAIRAVVTVTRNAGIMRADCPTALMMIPKQIRMKCVRAMAMLAEQNNAG